MNHAAALDDAVDERVRAIRAQSRPVFRGAALEAQTATDSELVLTGPAGTGKSIGLLHAIHRRAEKYPGSRHLILRKTRASLTNSALVTFEEKVLPKGHPVLFGDRGQRLERKNRSGYSYPNGSMIDLGGMDEATRLYSTEYDSVYWQEATEGTLTEWQSLLRSLRNNRMPFQQLAGDCNPSVPTHWIQDRAKSKALRLLESRHRDNPALWDGTDWTPYGTSYMAKLERLTGVLRNRLYLGLWVAAEGVVYDTFDATVHVWPGTHLPAGFRPHPSWRRVLGIDWGFRHPLVVQWWAVDGDGRMYLYRELYRTGRLVADVAREVRRISREAGEVIECAVADPADPEAIVVFGRESGIRCEPGDKGPGSIKAGIESIKQRLTVQSDGRARIYFGADALLERDPVLAEEHLPTSTIEELAVYQYQEGRDGKPTREEPLDKDNHGCDAKRYVTRYLDGAAGPIERDDYALGSTIYGDSDGGVYS